MLQRQRGVEERRECQEGGGHVEVKREESLVRSGSASSSRTGYMKL